MRLLAALPVVFAFSAWHIHAQTPPAAAPTNTVGAVTKIDASARTLTLKTDAGAEVSVNALPNASVRRVAPGETSLNNAATIALTDIVSGDRVLARGQTADGKVSAALLVVMSQGDIVKKQAAERADWDKRGVVGIVTAVAPESITVRSRTLAGTTQVTITPAGNAVIRRYEPDSVSFAAAKPARIDEIKVGDQVRARGEKSADGAKLAAEEIVSGTFKTIAGVVISADAEAGEVRVTNLETKKPMTIKVNKDSSLRRLQPQLAQMIAMRVHPELARTAPAKPSAGPGGPGGAGPGGAGAPPDFQQLLEKSPNITLTDLKPGNAIVVSSTVGAAADRVTAITLLAGVEPILTKPGTQQMALGAWTLDIGGGIGQ